MQASRLHQFLVAVAIAVGLLVVIPVIAQENQDDKAEQTTAAAAKPARAAFDKEFESWKDLLRKLRDIKERYRVAADDEIAGIRKEWEEALDVGNTLLPTLREAAKAAYVESPNEDRQLTRFLVKLANDAVKHDQYEAALDVAESMLAKDCPHKELHDYAGLASFALHKFDKAEEHFAAAEAAGVLSGNGQTLRSSIPEYRDTLWPEEQKLRTAEQDADLPRVKLTTNKGEILLELFENEAPDTVGNFISLVQKDYYTGLKFHRVLEGFMAQTGCPKGDGTGGPGYFIYCECDPLQFPKHRKHFRGSLSMAKQPSPNTGGSQFFITFRPTPSLNGQHTVFGRVLEGMDVVTAIQRIDPDSPKPNISPDTIVKAEVIRKRDHDYVPKKVNATGN